MVTEQGVAVKAWDHCVIPVMDLWRAERFYTEALGGSLFQKVGLTFEEVNSGGGSAPPGAFIKLGANHIGLFLQNRTPVEPPAALETANPCFGFEVEGDLAALARRVSEAGGTTGEEHVQTFDRVSRRALRATDSEGNAIELVAGGSGVTAGEPRVTRLSHMHFEALDLTGTAHFYEQFLGGELVDESSDRVVVGLPSGQQWFFHKVATLSPAMVGPYRGRHFAFHVTDEMFYAIVDRLHAAGIEEGDVRGTATGGPGYVAPREGDELGTYMNDPNGVRLQLINGDSAQAVAGQPLMRYTAT